MSKSVTFWTSENLTRKRQKLTDPNATNLSNFTYRRLLLNGSTKTQKTLRTCRFHSSTQISTTNEAHIRTKSTCLRRIKRHTHGNHAMIKRPKAHAHIRTKNTCFRRKKRHTNTRGERGACSAATSKNCSRNPTMEIEQGKQNNEGDKQITGTNPT